MAPAARSPLRSVLNATVVVSALGYFVDVYDLLLFSIVRVPSLRALGVPEDRLLDDGVLLLNAQMAGLLLGGILWGVLGDRRGRRSVLFGSIALYSVANLANAFVTTIPAYAALRFVAGVGLAGELGAAVTLVSEILPKETRGYGTAIVAAAGILGGVAAALTGRLFSWQTAFVVGGVLGLVLLFARFRLSESGLFRALERGDAARGDLRMLVWPPRRLWKYLACILVGVPIWYVVAVPITFAPEFGLALGVTGPLTAGSAVLFTYVGGAVGGFALGALSQRFGTRRWVIYWGIVVTAAILDVLYFTRGMSPTAYYATCLLAGFAGAGYWSVFVTNAAEQFGTNLRATVATTVPNFVRGATVPVTLAVQALRPGSGLVVAAAYVGAACFLLALLSLAALEETHGKELDYLET